MMSESRNIFVPGAEQKQQSPPSQQKKQQSPTSQAPVDPAGPSASTASNPTARTVSVSSSTATNAKTSSMLNKFAELAKAAVAKMNSLKKWTVTTYKNTKQSVFEQLGKSDKTVDPELDARIDDLRDLHRRYQDVLLQARQFLALFEQTNNMQRNLAESLYQLSVKESEGANRDLNLQSDSFRVTSQQGETLLRTLNYFVSSISTLTDSTIADTLLTIDHHDLARLEYDVSRHELEAARSNPNTPPEAIDEAEVHCNSCKAKYEKLKEVVRVKMTLLERNRCKVMRQQISLVRNALGAYYLAMLESEYKTEGINTEEEASFDTESTF